MPGQDLVFYGTTGPSGTADGQSQPDKTLWLGRFRASQRLDEFSSTFSATQLSTSPHVVVDSSRIGDGEGAHDLKWLLVQTGSGALQAARVVHFTDATGSFKLDRRFTTAVASGDRYAIFGINNVWPDVTPAQAINGDTRYRCIAMRNQHGAAIINVRYFLLPLAAGAFDMSRINQVTEINPFLQRANDTTDILDTTGQIAALGGPNEFSGASGWLRTHARATAFGEDASLANNGANGIWLRRTIPAGVRRRASVAVMVVASTLTAGSNPDPLQGAAIMSWNVVVDPAVILTQERYTHVGGGGRFIATVTDTTSGLAIPDLPIVFSLSGGAPATIATDNDPVTDFTRTDENGEGSATLSVLPSATAGGTATVTVKVPDGPELPNV
jgi:hypothetical protein